MLCSVVNYFQNHIDLNITETHNVVRLLTCFHGFPERKRSQASWDFIRSLASRSQLPWCIFGDFNDLLYSINKKGKHPHPKRLLSGFKNAIEDCSLAEVELQGCGFTYEKSKGTADWVLERLDRAFSNDSWWHMFPLCTLTMFHAVVSDHESIKLELANTVVTKKQFRFKFENTWLKEESFKVDVANYWRNLPAIHLLSKQISVSNYMAKWG